MLAWIRDWLNKDLRDELEVVRAATIDARERLELARQERVKLEGEAENMRRLITALRDVNADLDRRLLNGEN